MDEAVRLAGELPGGADFLGGGTDLLPNYKMHLNPKPHLIALDGIPEMRGRSLSRIGAMERLEDVERDAAIAARWPAVVEAAREVATPLVRASGTVGGNLLVETRCFFFNQSYFWRQSLGFCLKAAGDRCHVVPQKERCYATFSGDLAPTLLVHGAEVEIAGPAGRRRRPLSEVYNTSGDGIRRHRLAPGELIVAVHLSPATPSEWSSYRKLRVRPAFDFPELGVAVAARWNGTMLERLRIAAGGLETYPRTFDELTVPLEGTRPGPSEFRALADSVMASVRPVHNTSLPPDYRKKMTGVFVRRLLEDARRATGTAR
ncbi:MAG: FAD binding domain-containing protein [Thermoplasmata archaeon]|nr:FAD binding domain-containing protein [Thermoplasmata archaeon]